MPEVNHKKLTAANVLSGESPLVLTAILSPVAGLDRFQPAGFPEVGHVIYKAPRKDGTTEHVCIVDSAASMANHLESVCMRGPHDPDLVDDLTGMPFLRCVTGPVEEGRLCERQVVVTSLTEGHRIASSYFLAGECLNDGDGLTELQVDSLKKEEARLKAEAKKETDEGKKKELEQQAKARASEAKKVAAEVKFQIRLAGEFGLVLPDSKKAHPPFSRWWDVFETIFRYDPNALVHGVLFPQWQIKISRALTAHLEAFGAGRVDRSGVKFDRLGKTTSGQPIFAVDDATATEIRATFILDVALIRSFGRVDGEKQLGLSEKQKEFLVALALWKIERLLSAPFRFRSGCHLQLDSLRSGEDDVKIEVNVQDAIKNASFVDDPVTDVFWPNEGLYREPSDESRATAGPRKDEGGMDDDDGAMD